jgi:hypothetical protein
MLLLRCVPAELYRELLCMSLPVWCGDTIIAAVVSRVAR